MASPCRITVPDHCWLRTVQSHQIHKFPRRHRFGPQQRKECQRSSFLPNQSSISWTHCRPAMVQQKCVQQHMVSNMSRGHKILQTRQKGKGVMLYKIANM